MASSGSPNPNPAQPPPFELGKLFKPPNPSPNTSPHLNPNPNPNPAPFYGAVAPPAPTGPFSYPPATPPFHHRPYLHYPQDPIPRPVISYPLPNPSPNPSSPNPNPNPGARLMQLLGNAVPSHLESAVSMPPPSAAAAAAAAAAAPILPAIPSAPPVMPTPATAGPARMPSSKMPRGRHLGDGDRAVHDVDSRLAGESQPPQLEVTPITKYTSDPGLVLGRQIAVNKSYIVYGLKLGNIRVLNINTALRSLLRGHTQRVTDMAFFAEDVHLLASASVDGRVFVWKIDEGPDEENKPQITGKTVLAIQIIGDSDSYHPRICWHSHKQEILYVGIANRVLKIDTTKVGRGKEFTAEEPLKCSIDKLIDGVFTVGKHEGDVTDLSISQWMTTRLASASKDGTVKIWDDRKGVPLATLRPHDGQPVNSVSFLTAPNRPDHINFITAGPLNREVKIWSSASEEGWLLPSESESWNCTQTLDLRSSLEPRLEEAFFNQVCVLPQSGLIILANAKKNAIYAVHIDFGQFPAATRMDYIADFTVAMPILSLTGTSDPVSEGGPTSSAADQVVQVYCVQTMAIQQYALELSLCLPPTLDSNNSNNNSNSSSTVLSRDPSISEPAAELSVSSTILTTASVEVCPEPTVEPSAPPLLHVEPEASNVLKVFDQGVDRDVEPRIEVQHTQDAVSAHNDVSPKDEAPLVPNPRLMFKGTHLITPSEILSGALSSETNHKTEEVKVLDAVTSRSNSRKSAEMESKSESEAESEPHVVLAVPDENKEKPADVTERNVEETHTLVEESQTLILDGPVEPHVRAGEAADGQEGAKDTVTEKGEESTVSMEQIQSKKKERGKQAQTSGPPSPSFSPFDSTESLNGPGVTGASAATDTASTQILAMQDMLHQAISLQKDLQKQMGGIVSAPVTKEGKRIEAALGRNMEKSIKANVDALWARMQEDSAKHEKAERDRMQQLTTLITNSISKDLPALFERALKKEITALGPVIARAITPVIEKTVTSVIADAIQKGVGDKVVNQLDKSVGSKLEGTFARQIQAQFQISGKQAMQEALRSCMESTVVPAFEQSCKVMFEQVDQTLHKGMSEHTATIQQQVESAHTPLALTLRETINSATSITQSLTNELLDGQRKLLSIVASGNTKAFTHPASIQPTNGPIPGLPELVEAPPDPTKELSRLITERKYEDAFTLALQRSDLSIVSWLCSQVDLHGICNMVPIPLSQGVLLALLQQLACDIGNETTRKVTWITDVAIAINPQDPMIAVHVRPIFEQVYSLLAHQRSLPATSEGANLRLVMHVINSVLLSCK